MEHGTDWEERAISERWAELERQRRRANRLLLGLVLLGGGALLAGLGTASPLELCMIGGARVPTCTTEPTSLALRATLLAGGTLGVTAGLALCWHAFR